MNSDIKDEDILFKKSKNILLFNIDKIAPKPFLEEEINILIKKMNYFTSGINALFFFFHYINYKLIN